MMNMKSLFDDTMFQKSFIMLLTRWLNKNIFVINETWSDHPG
jgi:ATP/ADP translocase